MPRTHTIRAAAAVTALGAGLVLSACAPGGSDTSSSSAPAPSSVKTDAASLGNVTVTVWDQEVRGGQEKQMSTLNAQFHEKYPNITIKRVSRSFDDLVKTLRLALSGADAPDVVQANNTRSQMGEFVKAGQLVNLDPYATAYGWDKRYPESVRAVASYSPDGKTFGSGSLFGMPQVGEVVGIFYNDAKLKTLGINPPTTWADFDAALQTAKAKGEVPLVLGNLEKWPAGHVFGVVQGRFTKAEDIRTLGFGQPGGSWTTPENTQAAQTLVDWVDKGYFSKGFNGLDYDPAWQGFSKGRGVFLIAGSWLQADLSSAMGGDVKFMLPPARRPGQRRHHRGHRPAVRHHQHVEEQGRRRGVHRLHHQRERDEGARRDREPAGRRDPAANRPGPAGQGRVHGLRHGLDGQRAGALPRLGHADDG